MWNPNAFTEGKQADGQRQLIGLQTQVRQGGEREGWRQRLVPMKLGRVHLAAGTNVSYRAASQCFGM